LVRTTAVPVDHRRMGGREEASRRDRRDRRSPMRVGLALQRDTLLTS
jgi:hypothetical protein